MQKYFLTIDQRARHWAEIDVVADYYADNKNSYQAYKYLKSAEGEKAIKKRMKFYQTKLGKLDVEEKI